MATSFWRKHSRFSSPFFEAEIFHPVDADFDPQESAELLIHATHQILAVDAQHVMTVVELFEHTV
jgi:hypothetical protein